MDILELLRVIFLSIVQGITEWLPVSSTGHMILVDVFLNFTYSDEFRSVFFVVIQLASVMAVVTTFFNKLNPVVNNNGLTIDKEKINLWLKIIVASIPAAIIGIPLDDWIETNLGSPTIIALALIFYGLIFIVVENGNKNRTPGVSHITEITFKLALFIGLFQLLALIPGTSRSGATIIGGLMLGMSRKTAAEFTFFLAIPAMAGGSLIRLLRIGSNFTQAEWLTMIIGCVVAFIVSVVTIKFLLGFIKKNSFKPFAYYRIVLGIIVLSYFWIN